MKRGSEQMSTGGQVQVVTFVIDRETFSIHINRVQEIIMMQDVTRIPRSLPFVDGVLNLRGRVIPVISLRRRLGFADVEHDRRTRVVVVEVTGRILGLVVDRVEEVLTLDSSRIEPPPAMISGIGREFIEGVGKRGERIIVLLDIEKLFDEEEMDQIARDSNNK